MKLTNHAYFLALFLMLASFSQHSNAIIITNYTALFEDGSRLVIDLKGYDYGRGSFYASPTNHNEFDSRYPYTEAFDTFLYPSRELQMVLGGASELKIESESWNFNDGLYFLVDQYYGVSMTDFDYFFFGAEWAISKINGIYLHPDAYSTNFSGGFFKTYISPYHVNEPESLALIFFGISSLIWSRQRGNKYQADKFLPNHGRRLIS